MRDRGAARPDRPTEDDRIRDMLELLKVDARVPEDFRDDVMRAIAEAPVAPWRRIAGWWLRPRPVRVSPAVGSLVAAAIALVALWPTPFPPFLPDSVTSPGPSAGQVVTRFVLIAPEAASVHLTGDFLEWSPEGLALADPRGTGVWTADVPLPPGIYQYTFVIDGSEWLPDPRAVSQVDDGFGQMNSLLIVPSGGEV